MLLNMLMRVFSNTSDYLTSHGLLLNKELFHARIHSDSYPDFVFFVKSIFQHIQTKTDRAGLKDPIIFICIQIY